MTHINVRNFRQLYVSNIRVNTYTLNTKHSKLLRWLNYLFIKPKYFPINLVLSGSVTSERKIKWGLTQIDWLFVLCAHQTILKKVLDIRKLATLVAVKADRLRSVHFKHLFLCCLFCPAFSVGKELKRPVGIRGYLRNLNYMKSGCFDLLPVILENQFASLYQWKLIPFRLFLGRKCMMAWLAFLCEVNYAINKTIYFKKVLN